MPSVPGSPWQRAYIERVIGSIRRECLDDAIVYNEASLYRQMKSFVEYYHETRTPQALSGIRARRTESYVLRPATGGFASLTASVVV
jgi:transposase InsO family protein